MTFSLQPFPCDGKLYFFRDNNGVGGTGDRLLSYIDNYVSGAPVVTDVCPLVVNIPNSLAANPFDGYLYFLGDTGIVLYRVDMNCTVTPVCSVSTYKSNKGSFDKDGLFWCDSSSVKLLAIDINTCNIVKGPYDIPILNQFADISFNVYDCYFYLGDYYKTVRIDTNGQVVDTLVGFAVQGSYGGTAVGEDGKLYGLTNRVDTSTLASVDIFNNASGNVFSFSPSVYFFDSIRPSTDMASFPCNTIQVEFIDDTSVCLYAPVQFRDTSQGFVTNWLWNFGDNTTSTLQHPAHIYTNTGNYLVEFIASNTGAACLYKTIDTIRHNVRVNPQPVISVTSDTVCAGDTVTLSASGGIKYDWGMIENQDTFWFFNDSLPVFQNQVHAPSVYLAAGMDTNSCRDTVIFTAVPLPNPKPYINAIYEGGPCYPLEVSLGFNLLSPPLTDSLMWFLDNKRLDTSAAIKRTFLFSPDENYPVNHEFVLKTFYTNGCSAADTFPLVVCEDFYLPNAFTPSPKDGQNDFFVIKGIGDKNCRLMVFNRWGQKIFESGSYKNEWDGTDFAGKPLNADTYFYLLSCDDNYRTGWVSVIRSGE